MQFEFATANKILFGAGTAAQIAPHAAQMGKKVLLVTGKNPTRAQFLIDALPNAVIFPVSGEPTVELALAGVEKAHTENCDVVISIGGGSAIDTGKAIAALATNPGDPMDYMEVIGKGQAVSQPPLPFIAVPTTAGTGAEVTRNAVLASAEHRVKVSVRSPLMLPKLAIVDPELTYNLPPDVTASTGMDALTQLIEPFVSISANPLADALCREGIQRAARSLHQAYENGSDPAAREDMALASLFGGLALANAKLGAVHGFAGPLGGMYDAPHGAICAALLPHVMTTNIVALREREPDGDKLRRYHEVAQLLLGSDKARAEDGASWAYDLGQALNIPALKAFGIQPEHFDDIIDKSARSSSMKGNPITLTTDEMREILQAAW